LAALAERYVFTDPNTALIKIGQLAETLAKSVAARAGLPVDKDQSFLDIERNLRDRGLLDRTLHQIMRAVRLQRNDAVHNLAGEQREAFHQLKLVRQLAIWFHRTISRDPNFHAGPFRPPADPAEADEALTTELQHLREENAQQQAQIAGIQIEKDELRRLADIAGSEAAEAYANEQAALDLAEGYESQFRESRAVYATSLTDESRQRAAQTPQQREEVVTDAQLAAKGIDLNEFDTRKLIDQQLRDVGWSVDTAEFKYSKGTRPQKGRNLAIAEWPTSDGGSADYILFAGLTPVAAVEAKRRRKNAKNALGQAERYAQYFDIRPAPVMHSPGGGWDQYRLPFVFSTNGQPFHRQQIDLSGIWFRDVRRETNHPRALTGWYSPDGLCDLLGLDIPNAEKKLSQDSSDYLPLRPFQRKAIAAVERAILDHQTEILLAMATGTGKTRTAICLLYRLAKAGRFNRILFLVDRTSLGDQAFDAFNDVKLENHQAFPEIYDVKELGDLRPDRDTRLHIATVQAMVRRIVDIEDDSDAFPVDQYDCIVVDECHRGYILDQEMSETELSYRDQEDYISKYRRVLDHFDAVRIGLTATPALHTTEIFGSPVFEYSYRQAVIDHYLVDHEPPFVVKTKLSTSGIHWKPGEHVKILDTFSKAVVTEKTPDQIDVDIEGFNTTAITDSFNKVVCKVLADHIRPDTPGKTLIFCVRDLHADMVVRLLTDALVAKYGPQPHNLVQKITGNVDSQKELIRRFKNEALPKYVVTVDLLTTGIDVPAITNLVFLRATKSRILFEQMLGRATRLCEDLLGDGVDKEYFHIYDAVNIFAKLQPYTKMKPVVASAKTTFVKLAGFIGTESDPQILTEVQDQIVSKIRRKAKGITDKWPDIFRQLAGGDPEPIADQLSQMTPDELKVWLDERPLLLKELDKFRPGGRVLISDHEDQLLSVERGYGTGQKPEDYLESFRTYLQEHAEDLPAVTLVAQRPRDLTRAALRELQIQLEAQGYSERQIKSAVKDTTNQDIAATIIGFIRHAILDEPLIPYDQRVDTALQTILGSQDWKPVQRKWLDRIGRQIKENVVMDRDAFDHGAFQSQGGFTRLNKLFDGQLQEVVGHFVDGIWQVA
jgi:type I restriction enzyme, R subunit